MKWRCKFCGFKIKDREDRRRINIKDRNVYIIGFCDNCMNWNIFKTIPLKDMRNYIKKELEE